MTADTRTPLRASSMRACPRKAVLEATVPADREWTEQERRIMFRGKSIGHDFALMLASGAGQKIRVDSGPDYWVPPELLAGDGEPAGFVAELRVPWGFGTGHVDLYVNDTDTVIEILSSAYHQHTHSKLLQACTYARAIPDCQAVCLVIVNPADLSDERVIVVKGTDRWDQLNHEVEARLAQLQRWRDGEGLPARVCAKPSQARGLFCRHADTCFTGWEPDVVASVTDPDIVDAAAAFHAAKQTETNAKAALAIAEQARKDAQDRIVQADLEPGITQAGPYQVKRTPYKARRTFKLDLAEQDSRFPDLLLAEFVKVGEPYDVFTVERAGTGDVEYGDEAPF